MLLIAITGLAVVICFNKYRELIRLRRELDSLVLIGRREIRGSTDQASTTPAIRSIDELRTILHALGQVKERYIESEGSASHLTSVATKILQSSATLNNPADTVLDTIIERGYPYISAAALLEVNSKGSILHCSKRMVPRLKKAVEQICREAFSSHGESITACSINGGYRASRFELQGDLSPFGFETYFLTPIVVDQNLKGVLWLGLAITQGCLSPELISFLEQTGEYGVAALALSRRITDQQTQIETQSANLIAVSHDLRTPIISALCSLERLRHLTREGESSQCAHLINPIERSLSDQLLCIDALLDYIRCEQGLMSCRLLDVSLSDLLSPALEAHNLLTPTNRGRLVCDSIPDITLRCDPSIYRRILNNLLSNAIKYGEGKDILLNVASDSSNCTVTITDRGLGVPEEQRSQLFQPFFRGHNVRPIAGTGLGLSTCRTLAELSVGRLDYRPNHPSGSVFSLSFPIVHLVEAAPRLKTKLHGLLVVDDDIGVAQTHRRFLRNCASQVAVAHSFPEAFRLLGRVQPEAIITDINVGGVELFKRNNPLFDTLREVPVIIVTGAHESCYREEISELVNMRFLRKPVTRSLLEEAVRSLTVGH